MKRIILASNNQGKIHEIQQMVTGLGLEIVAQSLYQVTDIEETGLTFVENALLKARHAAEITGLPAIGDDSGLEVDALNGAPGIYSARYAGKMATDSTNVAKLLTDLAEIPESQRTARFQCLIVYLTHAKDPAPIICQGTWEGKILLTPQGKNGFGYDPIFYVPTHQCSAAEMPAQEKNRLSHRGQALQQLLKKLQIN